MDRLIPIQVEMGKLVVLTPVIEPVWLAGQKLGITLVKSWKNAFMNTNLLILEKHTVDACFRCRINPTMCFLFALFAGPETPDVFSLSLRYTAYNKEIIYVCVYVYVYIYIYISLVAAIVTN